MSDIYSSAPALPVTVRYIQEQFRLGKLTLRERFLIIEHVTGSVSEVWSETEARTLLSLLIAKSPHKLKRWAAEIETAS